MPVYIPQAKAWGFGEGVIKLKIHDASTDEGEKMQKLIINGGAKLKGKIQISGSKMLSCLFPLLQQSSEIVLVYFTMYLTLQMLKHSVLFWKSWGINFKKKWLIVH